MRSSMSDARFFLGEQPFPPSGLWDRNIGFSDVGLKTVRSTPIDTGVRNLVMILAGQSNMGSVASAAYSPGNPGSIDNLNVYDGQIYAAADPLLGSSYIYQNFGGNAQGGIGIRIADALITAGKFDRVILVPISIGGTYITQHADGSLSNRIPAAMARLKARGIVEQANVTFALLWGQGETDQSEGTSQAAYTAAFGRLVARARTAGLTGRIFVPLQTRLGGTNYAPVRAAQAACVDNGAGIFAGPDADAITSGRYADGTHFDTAGLISLTSAWQSALAASGAPF